MWEVFLYGIEWDDGNGEYDVSGLPENLCVTVEADHDDQQTAMEKALETATDYFGSCIYGTEQILAKPRFSEDLRE